MFVQDDSILLETPKLPVIQKPPSEVNLTIPLPSGNIASLVITVPMDQKDFDQLIEMLKVYETSIISKGTIWYGHKDNL